MMTHSAVLPRPRNFPSGLTLLAALELTLIAVLLRVSNTVAFYPAAIACSLCSIQLGVVLINRFTQSTRNIRKLARHAEYSSQAVFITDPQGRIKWANPRFIRLTGFGLAELAGKMFGMVLHGQETDTRSVERIRDRMRLKLPFEAEVLQYDRAGLRLWVSSKGQPIHDHRGLVSHYVVTQVDITEERRQSQAIIDELTKAGGNDSPAVKVSQLARQLESLASSDNRDQLNNVVEGIRSGMKECIAELPGKQSPNAQPIREVGFEERNPHAPHTNGE